MVLLTEEEVAEARGWSRPSPSSPRGGATMRPTTSPGRIPYYRSNTWAPGDGSPRGRGGGDGSPRKMARCGPPPPADDHSPRAGLLSLRGERASPHSAITDGMALDHGLAHAALLRTEERVAQLLRRVDEAVGGGGAAQPGLAELST